MIRTVVTSLVIVCLFMLGLVSFVLSYYLKMPGKSYSGKLPELTDGERLLLLELEDHVRYLSEDIGERNWRTPDNLAKAADYIEKQFDCLGCKVAVQEYKFAGQNFRNIEAEFLGTSKPKEIVVFGAHYDSVFGCPGANDNGTGVASLLTLAGMMKGHRFERTVRFVAFPNEESPFFGDEGMGSYQYARTCRKKNERIRAMLSLETMGYYSDKRYSQSYPSILKWFYPDTGNFIAFVGDLGNRSLVRTCVELFRKQAKFPCEGGSAPTFLPGINWSDHSSFSGVGYPAAMITDTAPFRYPAYHTPDDRGKLLDFARLAIVTEVLFEVLQGLADRQEGP